ncbi:MAG: retropepsin-like aspartic protease [Candidatus Eisenbacteria bacterium]
MLAFENGRLDECVLSELSCAAEDAERADTANDTDCGTRPGRRGPMRRFRSLSPLVAFELLFLLLLLFALFAPSGLLAAEPPLEGTLSIPFEIRDNLITIDVEVDGEVGGRVLPLMLDLGDFRAFSLSSAVLDSAGVEFTGGVDLFTNYAGTMLQARRFVAPSVRIAGRTWEGVEGSEDVYDPENPSPNPYGAVGRAFFADATLTLDYRNGRILVDESRPSARRETGRTGECVAFDPSGPILVDAEIDGERHRLLVDSGATHSILDESLFGETETFSGYSAYRAHTLTLGDRVFEGQTFLRLPLGQPDFSGILGYDFLSRTSPTLDLRSGCLYLNE